MYQKIILAFDGSHEARTALREGALLALGEGAAVWLLCVVSDNVALSLAEGAYPGSAERLVSAGHDMVREGLAKLRELGLSASGHVARGEPSAVIGAFAREVGADLIVLGHRRRRFLERWWKTPSGALVVDNTECSIVIARQSVSDAAFTAAVARRAVQRCS